ncbi:MAG TPA: trypsin-like peptidase domain-containing protein [Polyangia bacterium]|nr:trypsin-like peptidase domain-containing protein [Polyangia bacterium]
MRRQVDAVAVAAAGLAAALFAGPARAEHEAPLWISAPRHKPAISASAFADLAERARAAVVHVRGEVTEGAASDADPDTSRTSIGTGFIINRDGYVVTNEHVVRGVSDLRIRLYDGRELPACVAGADPATDIALVKIKPKGPLPVLPLGDSDAVRVGEPVIAIGNPFGFNHSVTAGIVSAKERVVDRSTLREQKQQDLYSFFIQTDASINLGNSGGPLIDAGGAVIGVSAAFWAGHPLQPAQGIGFAIPINMAKALLPRLARDGSARRSFLGVDAQPLDAALESALRLTSGRGALIASVEKGSPAEAAGLEPGDVVLTWNGAAVVTSEDLKINAQLAIPGSHARLAVVRDGKRMERDVVLRAATVKGVTPPHPASCALPHEPTQAAVEDFDVQELPPARANGLPGGRGVTVTRVTDHSAADQAGLKVGDVVLRIGKAAVRSPTDVSGALNAYKTGDMLPMLVRRSGFDFWMAFSRR